MNAGDLCITKTAFKGSWFITSWSDEFGASLVVMKVGTIAVCLEDSNSTLNKYTRILSDKGICFVYTINLVHVR